MRQWFSQQLLRSADPDRLTVSDGIIHVKMEQDEVKTGVWLVTAIVPPMVEAEYLWGFDTADSCTHRTTYHEMDGIPC